MHWNLSGPAGKDRTGVFIALLLMVSALIHLCLTSRNSSSWKLLGASDEDIAKDYGLTTIGLQPVLPLLSARLMKDQVIKNNVVGATNMGTAK